MRSKPTLVIASLVVLGVISGWGGISPAYSPTPDRIVGPIAGSPAVWLDDNRGTIFRPENDLGPVADSLKLENILLTFKLTDSQQADLVALLEAQQNRTSSQFHQWLSPEDYAEKFGLSQNDIDKVVAWLEAEGFKVTQTARSRRWISFTGTAAQVRAAFLAEIHNYSLRGRTYFANAAEPAVPAEIADVVLGLHGLDNYPLHPHGVFRQIHAQPQPDFTSSLSGNTFVSPHDFAIIYDVQNLYNAGIDGTGQSIAIVGQTDLYNNGSDIATFRTASGLPPNTPHVILIPGATDPGVVSTDIDEASLDVEWAGAVARNAAIYYVNGGNDGVFDAFQYIVDNKTAPVISISYGQCEALSGDLPQIESLAQQASSQGQTIVAAAGDSGAADCDFSGNPNSPLTIATQGLAVDFPASSPYVTGMGGSEFNEGLGDYWQAATSATGDLLTSALSYIPETVWNDTSSPQNTSHQILAGGGGVSMIFPKPVWQAGTGVPQDGFRDVPDLSLNASSLHDPYVVCIVGSCANGYRDADQTITVVGGTSMAAPTFAGIVALINQQMKTPGGQGNVNPTLYSMAQTSPAAFHDIVTGDNIVPCQVESTDTGCPASGEVGYTASAGYDQASGLGSIDAFNLVMEWGSLGAGNLPAPILALPANGATGVPVSPVFNWSAVTGGNGYRILIALSPATLPTNPATTTCSACTVADTSATNSYTPPSALEAGLYFWEVQAIEPTSSSGTAAWSSIFSLSIGRALPAPSLSAPTSGATAVSLPPIFTWSTVTGSAGYRILIASTQSALPTSPAVGTCEGCSLAATTTGATYTPPVTVLDEDIKYYWEVQALAASGGQNGTWSSVSNFAIAAPDFSLSASPSSFTISPGSSGTSTLTLTPINNFTATPAFTCTASSSLTGVTCSVGTLSNNTATITVTASSTAVTHPLFPRGPRMQGWWIAVAGLLCLLLLWLSKVRPDGHRAFVAAVSGRRNLSVSFPRNQSAWDLWILSVSYLRDLLNQKAAVGDRGYHPNFGLRYLALGVILSCLLAASPSCGGGGSGGGTPPATAESGTVNVTGTSTSISHSTTISISVS